MPFMASLIYFLITSENWNEKSFAHAQGLVKVIRKRLEAFDGNAKAYIA